MRKLTKKSLISIFATFAVAAIPAGFFAMNNMQARAENITSSEFYMEEGAAVRTSTDKLGIRFGATITEGYWTALQNEYGPTATYEFYSVVTDGVKPITKDYGTLTPDFTEGNEYTFYSTIVYNTDELIKNGLLDAARDLELSAQTYVKITKEGEETSTTIAAFGETGKRSMKAVANAAVLAGEADEELANYFTVGNRSESQEGYVFDDKSGFITMANLPEDTKEVEVYYGATKLDATYANGTVSFSGVELKADQTQAYISVFTGGKVYSSKIGKPKEIAKANVEDLLTLTGGEAAVLTEDIDLDGAEWKLPETGVHFNGTLVGNGHVIKNFTLPAHKDGWGFFTTATGTIKNVGFANVTLGKDACILGVRQAGGLLIENVFFDVASVDTTSTKLGVFAKAQKGYGSVTMTNVVLLMPKADNARIFGERVDCSTALTNVYTVGISTDSPYAVTTAVTPTANDCAHYADLTAFTVNEKTLTPFLESCVDTYMPVVKIYQDDADKLKSLADNSLVILMEDIDLGGAEWSGAGNFNGTLEGNGKVIKNFSLPAVTNGQGFFVTATGMIKNVGFANVTLGAGASVIAARNGSGTLTLENVFIQVAALADNTSTYGVLGQVRSNEASVVTMKNVVISMPKANKAKIFGSRVQYATTLTNVYTVGISTSAPYAVTTAVTPTANDCAHYADLTAFTVNEKTLTPFLESCVDTYMPVVKIYQDDADKLKSLADNSLVILMEDIDLGGAEWSGAGNFNGTLEGNGKVIKNFSLPAVTNGQGFFVTATGMIKNVGFANVTLGAGASVIAARNGSGTLTLENVFIQVAALADNTSTYGVLGQVRSNEASVVTMKSVVISMPKADKAKIFGNRVQYTTSLTNVYTVGISTSAPYAVTVKVAPTVKNCDNYADLSEFNTAEKTLTDFLTNCVATYLNANA